MWDGFPVSTLIDLATLDFDLYEKCSIMITIVEDWSEVDVRSTKEKVKRISFQFQAG